MRRLTSRHSFLDANPLARSEPVSVANSLDGHRNCLLEPAKKRSSDHCHFRGRRPFFFRSWTPRKEKHDQTPTSKAPKATATSRRPEPHPENTVQKECSPPVKHFRNLKRPRSRLRESGRPHLQIQCRSRPRELLSKHATSDPTPLPPLVTVRAGTRCPRSDLESWWHGC